MTDSVRALEFNAPLLVNDQNQVLAGHARLQAAMAASLATVPTVCLDHLHDAEQLVYLITDNRVAELAGWDDAQLTADLAAIQTLGPDQPATCRPGDLWQRGNHRLLCGDARDPAVYINRLGREHAQLVFTDPPYNVPIAGHVSGLCAHQHREFAVASGVLSSAVFM